MVAFLLIILFLSAPDAVGATESCNNTTTGCTAACSHVYDDCSLSLQTASGTALSEANCVTACASTHATVVSCLTAVSCSATAVDSCLQSGSSSGASDSGSDIDGNRTSGGGGGAVTDCNSCIDSCYDRYGGTAASNTCCTGCGCECELYCMPSDWWAATCL